MILLALTWPSKKLKTLFVLKWSKILDCKCPVDIFANEPNTLSLSLSDIRLKTFNPRKLIANR